MLAGRNQKCCETNAKNDNYAAAPRNWIVHDVDNLTLIRYQLPRPAGCLARRFVPSYAVFQKLRRVLDAMQS